MRGRESQILGVIWEWGGEASVDRIARETSMSTDYVRLVCECLARSGSINFTDFKLCKLRRKGKSEVAKGGRLQQRKIVISQNAGRTNYNKKRHFLLGY
ncbi:MAG: hypothetical protein WAP23_03145 [Candidatus Spechtbacterales bacterium]